ncbi:MAG: hypothetical protein IJD28_05110, partial [Deferribacterales bacterium]|nr:hypothetical protein [Deferribacterales bacterium]
SFFIINKLYGRLIIVITDNCRQYTITSAAIRLQISNGLIKHLSQLYNNRYLPTSQQIKQGLSKKPPRNGKGC